MKNFSVNVDGKEYWISRSVAVAGFIFKQKGDDLYALIEKRGKGAADYQGYWCFVCGYVDFDESVEQALQRESREELGFEIDINKLKFVKINSSPSENHQNITIHYIYFADEDENFDLKKAKGGEKDEIAEVKWFKIGEIHDNELRINTYDIMAEDWAFDHEKRMIEHLSLYYNLQYGNEKEEKKAII